MLDSSCFFRHIKDWIVYSQKFLYTMKDRPELMCYGVGSNAGGNSWGMQTNQKALSSFIIASYEKSINWEDSGLTAEKVREQGIAMLRFTLESHLTGSYHCTDGRKWGHNWISTLGTARMMHAVNAVWDELTNEDKSALRRVFISEADWLLNEYPITAGLVENNHPESNIWNGALLYQTACMYPDAPNAAGYKDKATRFIINGISAPKDSESDVVYDGIRVKDAFVGANMFDNMACNHHGYMNVGYMVICLSNLAMLYFWCRDREFDLPEVFDHHVMDLWKLVRNCTFEDGRLWRIGGDTRVRYCYCQDYALPMWALMSEKYGEDCSNLMKGWLEQVRDEVENNGDGSFLSDRLSYMLEITPYYYTRLESDRACTLSMVGHWVRKYGLNGKKKPEIINAWHDEYHGSAMQKSKKRKASFTWLAGERPTAMLIPADESNLAEWQQNMTGKATSFGAMNEDKILCHKEILFDGGFLTYGKTATESRRFYCEGYRFDTPAIKSVAYAVLPDDATALCIQRAVSPNRIFARSYASLMLRIPNDVYNKNIRHFYTDSCDFKLQGGKYAERKNIKIGKWINIDGKMGVASLSDLVVKCPEKRQIDIVINEIQDSNREGYGTLYCNDIVAAYSDEPQWLNPGDEVYRCAFAVNIGDMGETKAMAESVRKIEFSSDSLLAVGVIGKDGNEYVLVQNISKSVLHFDIPEEYDLFCGNINLEPAAALLLCRRVCV